jgi:hypothetical protein
MNQRVNKSPTVCACGQHAFAAVGRGFNVIVDADDIGVLLGRRWHITRIGRYVGVIGRDAGRTVILARQILSPPDDLYVDHINGDSLDNRRVNLRTCTPSQNAQNRRRIYGKKWPKGVHFYSGGFYAFIRVGGKRLYLGRHKTVEDAKAAYDAAAVRYQRDFARLE